MQRAIGPRKHSRFVDLPQVAHYIERIKKSKATSDINSGDRKRVLLLSLVFPPDAVSTAQLFGELVEDLVQRGWDVTVVTTTPHYRPDPIRPFRQSARRRWGGLIYSSSFAGAAVFHAAMPRKDKSIAKRLAGWLGFHMLSIAIAAIEVGRVDVVLAPSPPLTIGIAAWLIGLVKGAPFIYNVQELYPDIAVALGVIRQGHFLRLLHAVERFVYARAYAITTIAPRMRARIQARVSDPSKVLVIQNFVDTGAISARPRDNPFAREFGLDSQFVVMYLGNMGPAQGLDTLLEAAALTAGDSRIRYVFVGDGVSRSNLERLATTKQLSNVLFVPQQPYARVPDIYGSCDLCVVSLASGAAGDAVPSKVYRIMAAERPVLVIADPDSDVARVVIDAQAGIVAKSGDAESLAAAIVRAAAHPEREAGSRGRRYVLANAERQMVTGQYSDLLAEAVDRPHNGARRISETPLVPPGGS